MRYAGYGYVEPRTGFGSPGERPDAECISRHVANAKGQPIRTALNCYGCEPKHRSAVARAGRGHQSSNAKPSNGQPGGLPVGGASC